MRRPPATQILRYDKHWLVNIIGGENKRVMLAQLMIALTKDDRNNYILFVFIVTVIYWFVIGYNLYCVSVWCAESALNYYFVQYCLNSHGFSLFLLYLFFRNRVKTEPYYSGISIRLVCRLFFLHLMHFFYK